MGEQHIFPEGGEKKVHKEHRTGCFHSACWDIFIWPLKAFFFFFFSPFSRKCLAAQLVHKNLQELLVSWICQLGLTHIFPWKDKMFSCFSFWLHKHLEKFDQLGAEESPHLGCNYFSQWHKQQLCPLCTETEKALHNMHGHAWEPITWAHCSVPDLSKNKTKIQLLNHHTERVAWSVLKGITLNFTNDILRRDS